MGGKMSIGMNIGAMANQKEKSTEDFSVASHDIAVVGMACRLPGADSVAKYWENLKNGVESIDTLSKEQLLHAGVEESVLNHPNYVLRSARMRGVDQFDPTFFGMSAQDASIMDPQHRHFLEVSWQALESAGIDPDRFSGLIGCYAGSGHNAYMPYHLFTHPELMSRIGFFLVRHTGNDKDFLTTRASYLFNLKGPSVNVQTACSTSLVAIHMATQSLLNGECDVVMAGGTTIEMPGDRGYLFKEGEILSRDGHCKPFEANSTGTLFGSGVGVVVLMRLEQAMREGYFVHAVVKGSAINNDGSGKVSYLAPSVDGQASVITEALTLADIDPETIGFVECHGTGTAMGDPIEVEALTTAFQTCGASQQQYCALGSVKSNIGHLDTAAGAASFIKATLALSHRLIPPTLHFETPNPNIDFKNSPFYVNSQPISWDIAAGNKRRAGVSSLGVGGTNAHILLEEAPPRVTSPAERASQLFLFSAKTKQSLQKQLQQQAVFVEQSSVLDLADMAYTLKVGRKVLNERVAIVADTREVLAEKLSGRYIRGATEPQLTQTVSSDTTQRHICFMYAGGGAQYPNMGRDLYEQESVYRAAVDECLGWLKSLIDYDLKALLYPNVDAVLDAEKELERPSRSLPALFVTQYAYSKLLGSWGIEPQSLVGHSLGENTAACLSGVLSLKDALGLVSLRGQLFERVQPGGMLSVQLSEAALKEMLPDTLSIACLNAPDFSVVSGPKAALDAFQEFLEEKEIVHARIRINIAAHSKMLEEILKPFGDYLRSIVLNPPKIPFLSNLTGTWITAQEATSADYWVKHLRHTVRFSDNVAVLFEDTSRVLLEVGPGRTLARLAQMHSKKTARNFVFNSMRHVDEVTSDVHFALSTLGQLWALNAFSNWASFYGDEKRCRISLPTYAFDHQRYWIEPGEGVFAEESSGSAYGLTRKKQVHDWLYRPSAIHQPLSSLAPRIGAVSFLIVCWQSEPFAALEKALVAMGHRVNFMVLSQTQAFDWQKVETMSAWLESLVKAQSLPTQWLFTLEYERALAGQKESANQKEKDWVSRDPYFVLQVFFHLAKAMNESDLSAKLRLNVLTRQQAAVGYESVDASQSLTLGALKVLGSELSLSTRVIDLAAEVDHSWQMLAEELCLKHWESQVLLRGVQRFIFQWTSSAASSQQHLKIAAQGVYLITGGLGGLGLLLAEYLASTKPVKVILLSRKGLPARETWDQWLEKGVLLSEKIRAIRAIEAKGSVVWCATADVTSLDSMHLLQKELVARFGALNGIFHVAGHIEDDLIALKSWAEVRRVLAPKVLGAEVLDQLWPSQSVDFTVYFSSVSAMSGLPGQFDYAAANAYLDGFSAKRTQQGGLTVSINWPAWQEVGMASNVLMQREKANLSGDSTLHPALDFCLEKTDHKVVFATECSVERFWMFDEHRLNNGQSLIPGTAYLELVRAAFAELAFSSSIELRQLSFNVPFALSDKEIKALYLTLYRKGNDHFEFVFESKTAAGTLEHARGEVLSSVAHTRKYQSADEIFQRCCLGKQSFTDAAHHPFLHFGDRWSALKTVYQGTKEALIELECSDVVSAEMLQWKLHPALMDVAIAGAQVIIPDYQPFEMFYVPVGYGHVHFNQALPKKIWSHVRINEEKTSAPYDSVYLEVVLFDAAGHILLEAHDFLLKKVVGLSSVMQLIAETQGARSDEYIQKIIALGVAPGEGMKALELILSKDLSGKVAVSPYVLKDYLEEVVHRDNRRTTSITASKTQEDPEAKQIEALLLKQESLEKIAVRIFNYKEQGRRVLAFYQLKPQCALTMSELRRYAKEHLAQTVQPSQWIEMDRFPTDINGETDYTQLLDPQAPVDRFATPKTNTEKELAKIWQAVLGVERIGLTDNFLDSGGHSLLGIRLITRVEKALGVRLNQAILALQTLEQIAKYIDDASPVRVPACMIRSDVPISLAQPISRQKSDELSLMNYPIESRLVSDEAGNQSEADGTLFARSRKIFKSLLGNRS